MPENSESAVSAPIKVLLVEDHQLTRIGLKTVLSRTNDITVVGEATNGEEAIAQARALNPDVILMDVGMPVLDGIQAAKKILEGGQQVDIVMLTSHDNDADILASFAAGAAGYCLKDVDPDRLYSAIRSVCAGDVWLDSTIAGKVLKNYSPAVPASSTPQEPAAVPPPAAARSPQSLPEPLSPRELEVLNLVVEGLSNQQIADRLIISLATAKTHVRNILNKLAVDDRTQAAVQAMRRGLV